MGGACKCKQLALYLGWLVAFLLAYVSQADEPTLVFNLGTVLQMDSSLAVGEQAARCVGTCGPHACKSHACRSPTSEACSHGNMELTVECEAGHPLTCKHAVYFSRHSSNLFLRGTGTEMMARGHRLTVDRLNEGNRHGQGGHVTRLYIQSAQGKQHRILFNYTRYQAPCDEGEHNAHVEQAITEGAHFLLGNTHFAFSEAAIANKAQRLVYHCCSDTDELFDLDYKYVYGMTGSVQKDTRQALTSMALEGSISKLFVYYTEALVDRPTDPYARTCCSIWSTTVVTGSQYTLDLNQSLVPTPLSHTEDFRYATVACMAAIEHATTFLSQLNADFKLVSVLKYSFQNVSSVANFYDSVLAEEVVRSGADAVVGCDSKVKAKVVEDGFLIFK
eukprot:1158566-Pelagomonas_calceolata.AAC.8